MVIVFHRRKYFYFAITYNDMIITEMHLQSTVSHAICDTQDVTLVPDSFIQVLFWFYKAKQFLLVQNIVRAANVVKRNEKRLAGNTFF